ncbi:hypothetical protein Ana3638_04435 [Anaerocolumna sedimenticola]|uniref:WG repeat-containing protein n=1 Tax=Anaerocolumna sedimenticola TaxID=2696063 RepID=A0A6P1TI57_9FIRM|nr:WG repeat-containing protein [Anaerocolumna sedimenticola]QHQ60123.1 hypothetical protein Ana3638_04435 [Anaerocolumna sedimenticola]
MKQLRNYIRKAALVGIIIAAGYSSCAKNVDAAYAPNTAGSLNMMKSANMRVLLAETDKSTKSVKANDLYPISVQTDGKVRYGYINNTGKMVIQPIYESGENFSEGLAVVYNNNKNQVINQKGEIIFETELRLDFFISLIQKQESSIS